MPPPGLLPSGHQFVEAWAVGRLLLGRSGHRGRCRGGGGADHGASRAADEG